MNSGSTPGTSYGLHAKTSTFCKRNNNISTLSRSFMLVHIWKYLLVSGKILTFKTSSAQLAPASSRGFCNCYEVTPSVVSFCSFCSAFHLTMAIRHYLAIRWFPRTTATPYSVGNLTFTCRVDGTAFIAWIHDLPKISVYGENDLTIMKVTITSLPSIFTGREIWPSGVTTLPSNETSRVSFHQVLIL